jgi:transposase
VVEGWDVVVLTDVQWAELEPLVSACRPHAKVPPSDLRRTVEAIVWRCTNGAKWRSIPAELGPWWKAAQIFIRWACVAPVAQSVTLSPLRSSTDV